MRRLILGIVLLAMAPVWGSVAMAAEGPTASSENVEVRLVSDRASIAPGETFHIGLYKDIAPEWHTYWRNAGDAGEATEITWDLPQGLSAGEIIWPTPEIYSIGGVVTNYIFEDELLLNVPFEASPDLTPGQTLTIRAELYWQECAEICIPVDNIFASLELPVVAPGASQKDPKWAPRVESELALAAQPLGFAAGLERQEDHVALTVADDMLAAALAEGALRNPYFFPYDGSVLDHNAPQPAQFGTRGVSLALAPGRALRDALPEVSGVLAFEERRNGAWARRSVEITAQAGPVSIGAITPPAGAPLGLGGLLGLVAASFLGGLILNLMPCVFPVLSIKALSFAGEAHEAPGVVRRHGLVFLAGVLTTFLAFAGVILALKAAGSVVGWGFQLQSPVFVTAMAVLMFAIGLNMMGFFEVGTSLQGVGGGLADKGGDAGAFFTGVLAVAVAAPCVGPFLGAPLGYALSQPAYVAFGLFLAIGAGLAAPFVALSFAPGLLRYLPKPGAWMETFKQALAFPMFLTALWLVWTLAQQAGADGVGWALLAMIGVSFSVWAWKAAHGARKTLARAATAAGLLVAVGATGAAGALTSTVAPASQSVGTETTTVAAISEAWSPERVAALRAEGRGVFVDFTAAWCITCQVNKRTTLTRANVQEAFAQNNITFLTADWTNRDAVIAQTLEQHGRAGVPLYLLYGPEGEPLVLPQLLTPQIVMDAVEGLAKNPL